MNDWTAMKWFQGGATLKGAPAPHGGEMRRRAEKALPSWFALLVLLMASTIASANDPKKKTPPPPPTHNAPSKPAASGRPPATGAAHGTAPARGANTATPHGNAAHGAAAPVKGANTATPHGNAAHGAAAPAKGANTATAHGAAPAVGANVAHGTASVRPSPTTTNRQFKSSAGATQAHYRDGHVRSIQTPRMRIDRGLHGDRRVVTEHNGRRIVTSGSHGGYSQRAYIKRGGRVYTQRTYFVGGHRYAYAYRSYLYGGASYYGYAPAYYFAPAYYGWAYNPWPAPVDYQWGWSSQPWYGYYDRYFAPYPVYPNASAWLTDYILSESLKAAFEARSSGTEQESGAAQPLTPEVKQAIADEVRRQTVAEQTAAANSERSAPGANQAPPALDPNSRIFLVSNNLDTTTATGQECSLSPGDVILRISDTVGDDNKVDVTVKGSKKDECFAGSRVWVDLSDLQEMHNHLRQLLDTGLKALADNSGKNGLPLAPDTNTRPGEVPPPTPDGNVDSDLQHQQKDADQMEKELQQQDSLG
jgi:hypothetical protein